MPRKKVQVDTDTWLCGPPSRKGQTQQFPSRFMFNLKKRYPDVYNNDLTLLMFSGSQEWGITTDIREETGCMIPCPFDEIPFGDGEIAHVVADPPYADHYAKEWHSELPKPKHILREAARMTKVGGLIMILHIIVVPAYTKEFTELGHPVERIAIHPILTGVNNALRALSVFRRVEVE